MQKLKTVTNPVGATSSRPHFEDITKNKKGITLIALIITIIVMLILVGVTVSVALNGGLFSTAKDAADRTELEKDKETALSNGEIEIGGVVYSSIEDYKNKKAKLPDNAEEIPESEAKAEGAETANWDLSKVRAIEVKETDGSTETIPLPKGFAISLAEGENTVSEGLVIKDGENEFVWVPVTNAAAYTEYDFGPLEDTITLNGASVKYDSYQTIQYYYGNVLGTINNDTSFNTTFSYKTDKANIERSIRTYGGFYVGRYETTYDELSNGVPQGIGVKQGKDILKADNLLKPDTETKPVSNENYYYRWWGLYKAQKDMYADSDYVGSLMISDDQWKAIMDHTGYEDGQRPGDSYANLEEGRAIAPDKSGSAYSTNANQYDEAKNIYDLAGNLIEWTITDDGCQRSIRGGSYVLSDFAASYWYSDFPNYYGDFRL